MSARVTRSASLQPGEPATKPPPPLGNRTEYSSQGRERPRVQRLPDPLVPRATSLKAANFQLLLLKQQKLRHPDGQIPRLVQERETSSDPRLVILTQTAAATLVFAQEEAGTAVCISPSGLLLTCSHCIADDLASFQKKRERWLLLASGLVVKARCVAWDGKRDLALLQIVAAQVDVTGASTVADVFPFIQLAQAPPKRNDKLLCIGHPGSEDLEASQPDVETNFDVLHISSGRFRGLEKDQDPHDNSDIGALKHDCWTYWGHSGAPLIDEKRGNLVGLHSSWDDQTGMRRGVAWEAIRAFLDEHGSSDNNAGTT